MFFKDNLPFLRKECKEIIPSVDVNLVKSCLNFIEIFFKDMSEKNKLDKISP